MVIILVTVLMGLIASILVYAGKERVRAVAAGRNGQRQSCAESGLQLARSYYGRNFHNWNTYVAAPSTYDPVRSSYNANPADPNNPALQTAHPELFADLDGDGKQDVFLYIRDNDDELFPLPAERNRDNDHNVVVGAVCISSTLTPRSENTVSPTLLAHEGLLSYNGESAGCLTSNAGNGTGNCN
jgi:type II secretory pathway pseudopilin PulG